MARSALIVIVVAALAAATARTAAAAQAGLTVEPIATYTGKTRTVTVHGTFLCAGAIEITALNLNLIQHNGRPNMAFGAGSSRPSPCDGKSHPWEIEISAADGKFGFTGGTINVDAFFFACDVDACARFHVNADVKLVGHDA